MATLAGRGGRVYLAPDPSSAAVPIGQARSWAIDIKQDLIENTQGFGQIWKTYLIASTGWSGSIEGNFDTTNITPFSAANVPGMPSSIYGPVNIYLYPNSLTLARYYCGTIWPNLSIHADMKSTIKYQLNFTGNDALYMF